MKIVKKLIAINKKDLARQVADALNWWDFLDPVTKHKIIKPTKKKKHKKTESNAKRYYTEIGKGNNTVYINMRSKKEFTAYVIVKSYGAYSVLSIKEIPRATSFNLTHVADRFKDFHEKALPTIKALHVDAKDMGIEKYFKEDLTPEQFTNLLLLKENFSVKLFNRWFPDLKEVEEKDQKKVFNFDVKYDGTVKDVSKQDIKSFIEKASKIVTRFGLPHILYGKVLIVNDLPGIKIAVYDKNMDLIKISRKAVLKYTPEMGRNFIHELGHRLWAKGLVDTEAVKDMYRQASTGHMESSVEAGDVFKNAKGQTVEVLKKEEPAGRGPTLFIIRVEGYKNLQKVPSGYFTRLKKMKGVQPIDPKQWIPSDYSLKNAEEWFCEILAYGLDHDIYKDFLRKVIK